jgi:hypothetical protein
MATTGQTGAFKVRLTQRFLETVRLLRKKACGDSSRLERKSFPIKAGYMSAILISV